MFLYFANMSDSLIQDFWKWGDPAKSFHLDEYPRLKVFLEERFQAKLKDDFKAPDLLSTLPESKFQVSDFEKNFPDLKSNRFSNSKADRLKFGFGKSYHDIVRIFKGQLPPLGDFVLYPESEQEILYILKQASAHQIRIIPFSGGSNVTGAFELASIPQTTCYLNLQRMKKLVEIDAVSCTATFETGIFGPELEKILNQKGFTLGHFPQSFEYSTLGGWLATRSGGQESGQYGKIEDIVLGIHAATPVGLFTHHDFPHHASGIDTFRLFIGSEGTLGVITQAKVRIHPLPKSYQWIVSIFKTYEDGIAAVRALIQSGIHPGIVRLSDPLETSLFSKMRNEQPTGFKKLITDFVKKRIAAKGYGQPAILMLRFAYRQDADVHHLKTARQILKKQHAYLLPASTAGNWAEHRFSLPYLRDTLIEHRVLIDTFETVTYWKDVASLYQKVKASLNGSGFYEKGGLLFCHISHVYETGACQYFTMIAPQEKGNEPAQWQTLKTLVTDALVEHGAAISHHHGIGKDHRKWYLQQTTESEKRLLSAVKKHLDPNGIMNPEKLFDGA